MRGRKKKEIVEEVVTKIYLKDISDNDLRQTLTPYYGGKIVLGFGEKEGTYNIAKLYGLKEVWIYYEDNEYLRLQKKLIDMRMKY